ncbi:MAG: porin [Gammaproteobacteria bacterium]|nr:porin [Gammaproteobacteria bacterium]
MMTQKHTSKLSKALILAAALTLPGTSLAAGFQLSEQSGNGLGRAFAGGAAWAENATTVFYNPAGMTRLEDTQLVFGASVITLGADFDRTVTVDAVGQPLTGGEGGDVGKLGGVPTGYFVMPIDEKWTFGLGLNAPFGLSTDHPIDWVGRYQAVYSHVSTFNINPSMGYEIDDNWSVGFGLNLQNFRVKLTNMVDYGAVCFGNVDPLTCSGIGLTPQSYDGYAEVEGDGWNFGVNFGVMWANDATRVGFHYRGSVDHELEGDATFIGAPALFAASDVFVDTGIKADFKTPETLSLSVVHAIDNNWTLSFDATRTGWDTFQELRIRYDSAQPDTVEDYLWEDAWRYAIGVDYKYSNEWTFRAGYAFDETPIAIEEARTPRLPDADRNWLSFGASYKMNSNMMLNFGYSKLFLDDDIELNKVGSQGDTLRGTYEAAADIFGAELVYSF